MTNQETNLTITTICDASFFWGAYLLVASHRIHQIPVRFHILHQGFSTDQMELLSQFSNVALIALPDNNPRNLCTRKAEAMLTADTEWIGWMDADCIATGDIANLLIPSECTLQARVRSGSEESQVYSSYYNNGDQHGQIPNRVMSQWKSDVADLDQPQIQSTCVTNVMVIHRKHRRFLKLWRDQTLKVIAPMPAPVTLPHNPPYVLSDESVFNSLMAFSSIAPKDCEYALDRDPQRKVVHFVENPKPWVRWKHRHWRHRDQVLDVLDTVLRLKYQTGPLPSALRRDRIAVSRALALTDGGWESAKKAGRSLLRRH